LKVNLTVYVPRKQILQQMCSVHNLPIVSVYSIRLADGSFQWYINAGILLDDISSWSSAVPILFHGAPMPTEYTVVNSAADGIIQFLCTHKNVKVNDVN
jgi:hypothetical protein